jgi:MFS family permease
MLIGRIVYGFGGESLGVANSTILSKWFVGKELALAFGLNLSVARLGTVVNNLASPSISISHNVPMVFWIGFMMTSFSVLFTLLSVWIQTHVNDHIHSRNRATSIEHNIPLPEGTFVEISEKQIQRQRTESFTEAKASIKDALHFSRAFWVIAFACIVFYGTNTENLS